MERNHSKFNRAAQLKQYLKSNDEVEMKSLATPSNVLYIKSSVKAGDDNFERLSLLEIISQKGKLKNVEVYLKESNPTQLDVLKSFYRALEAKNSDVALKLLKFKNTRELVATIELFYTSPFNKELNADYLEKISRTNHYPFRFNSHANRGNVALILSAGLPDSMIFEALLECDEVSQQLDDSGIAAFLFATLDEDGAVKKAINLEIAFRLLEIPFVYSYVKHKRAEDYSGLLALYHNHQSNIQDCPSPAKSAKENSGLTSVSSNSSISSMSSVSFTGGLENQNSAFFSQTTKRKTQPSPFAPLTETNADSSLTTPEAVSQPSSVMETLLEANPRASSVMTDDRDEDEFTSGNAIDF